MFVLRTLRSFSYLLLNEFLSVCLLRSTRSTLTLDRMTIRLLMNNKAGRSSITDLRVLLRRVKDVQSTVETAANACRVVGLVGMSSNITFLRNSFRRRLSALFRVTAVLNANGRLSRIRTVSTYTLRTLKCLVLISRLNGAVGRNYFACTQFTSIGQVILLNATRRLSNSVRLLLSTSRQVILLCLVESTNGRLIPVLELSTSALLFVFVVVIIVVILVVSVTRRRHFISQFIVRQVVTVRAHRRFTLAITRILTRRMDNF